RFRNPVVKSRKELNDRLVDYWRRMPVKQREDFVVRVKRGGRSYPEDDDRHTPKKSKSTPSKYSSFGSYKAMNSMSPRPAEKTNVGDKYQAEIPSLILRPSRQMRSETENMIWSGSREGDDSH